jgi:hypothetical protein
MYRFQQRLKNLKQHIKSWNKSTFGNIFQAQDNLNKQIQSLQQQIRQHGLTDSLKHQETHLNNQLAERREQEEILWRQKSRIQWLKEGERNTKFFHRSMIQRLQSNHITHLVSDQGTEIQQHTDIEKEMLSYYKNLLSEPPVDRSHAIETILKNIPKDFTKENNEALMRLITQEEVDQSLRDTPIGKALGLDRFTLDFFHHCWSIIRTNVWEIIEDSRRSGQVLQALNATFLTLIPKENHTTSPLYFWPISLYNVIYKLLTKIIATRLKPILPFIILQEQSGYVEGRQILDNVILAHEVIHSLHSTKSQGMLLKLDLSKAFDKLSWSYLKYTLLAFGFEPNWISWIINLTSSALFSILINGIPSRPFSPTRGIRQGDLLSPFLFIIMAEGLSHTIKETILDQSLSGLTPNGFSPPISHNQFVDGLLLMGVPTTREAIRIKSIITLFCEASGMEVNLSKSHVLFFNTPPEIQNHLTLLLGFTHSTLPSTYLGIPLIDNPLRNLSWESIPSKFRKRLSLWTFHSLNLHGRLILLKFVLQALPIYAFSALAAPSFILNTLRNIQRKFLWQGTKEG